MTAVRRRQASRSNSGFTLIEVVVALAILSLIMLATVSGLRTLGNTQATLEAITGRVDEVRTVSSFLRETLESSIIGTRSEELSLGGGGGGKAHFFQLDEGAMAWKSMVLFGESFGGSYFVRVAKENDLLVLRWQEPLGRAEPGNWDEASSRTLVSDVQEFDVSFRTATTGEWLDNWRLMRSAIVVKLRIKASGRYWPDLIMRVPR